MILIEHFLVTKFGNRFHSLIKLIYIFVTTCIRTVRYLLYGANHWLLFVNLIISRGSIYIIECGSFFCAILCRTLFADGRRNFYQWRFRCCIMETLVNNIRVLHLLKKIILLNFFDGAAVVS